MEAWLVPERPMIAHVERRLQAAREAIRGLQIRRDLAEAEARAAAAAADRADQEWRRTMDSDLRGRVEIALHTRDPGEVRNARAALLTRKQASYRKASTAAAAALEAERALADQAAEAGRFRAPAHWMEDLPPAAGSGRSDRAGALEIQVAPGRYALVARQPDAPVPGPAWMLWVEVRADGGAPLELDVNDQIGSGCDACVVPAGDLR